MILNNRKTIFLAGITIVIVFIIFLVGLWPLNFAPKNEVSWLPKMNGIRFYGRGIIYGSEPLQEKNLFSFKNKPISIEIWLKPTRKHYRYLPQIFSLYDGKETEYFALCQWKSNLVILGKRKFDIIKREPLNKLGLQNALPDMENKFLTVTSGIEGTSMYLDGKLEKHNPKYSIMGEYKNISGQIILGNSSTGKYPWNGDILGLAIYNRSLGREEVLKHYKNWSMQGTPSPQKIQGLVALFLFDEHDGTVVHNYERQKHHLVIPKTFKILKKSVLILPKFKLNLSLITDMLINLFGFIPFGFFFSNVLNRVQNFSKRNLYLITIITAGSISLTVELIQVYLPTRTSSLADLTWNILGTVLGVFLFSFASQINHFNNRAHS